MLGCEVERGTTGMAFITVAAAGTSSTLRAYALLDGQLPAGADRFYHRLRQVDADGTTAYSLVRVVSRPGVTAVTLQAYPNPVRGAEHVRVPRATVSLRVFMALASWCVPSPRSPLAPERCCRWPACPRAATCCAAALAVSA